MELVIKETLRHFIRVEFKDLYGSECSLQESSLAEVQAIWFGVDVDFQTRASTRMHLSVDQVKELLPFLHYFVEHGILPSEDLRK